MWLVWRFAIVKRQIERRAADPSGPTLAVRAVLDLQANQIPTLN